VAGIGRGQEDLALVYLPRWNNARGNFRGGGGRNKRRLGGTSSGIFFHMGTI